MSQASVRSVDAIRDFKAALAVFGDDATGALGAVDMEIKRAVHWLTHEQRVYWQAEIKRRKEKLSMAQAELSRKKLSQMHGHSSSHSEQKELVRVAAARLEDAERRALALKKWEPVLQQTVLEYRSRVRRLLDLVGGDMPRAQVMLDRVLDSLEAYLRVAPPSVAPAVGPSGTTVEATAAVEGSAARPVADVPPSAGEAEGEPAPEGETKTDGPTGP